MISKKALILEDAAVTALDLKYILRDCGFFNSIIIDKGQKAIDFIEIELPSIALLDIKLADNISGIEVAKLLKQKNVPFIFISAFSNQKNLKLAKELNPLGIVSKPFNGDLIKMMLNNELLAKK